MTRCARCAGGTLPVQGRACAQAQAPCRAVEAQGETEAEIFTLFLRYSKESLHCSYTVPNSIKKTAGAHCPEVQGDKVRVRVTELVEPVLVL